MSGIVAPLGFQCSLAYDTASNWTTPTWVNMTEVRDATLNLSKGEGDVSSRGSTWKLTKGALKDASVTFEMVWDTSDANFVAFINAYLNGTQLHCAVMDALVATSKAQGLEAWFEVFKFSRKEPLEGAVIAEVEMKPSYNATNMPAWKSIA